MHPVAHKGELWDVWAFHAGRDVTGLLQMKVLLRNRATGRYYAGPNQWSAKSSVAHDFEEVYSAVRFVRTQKLSGVEAILRYDDPACDLVLPLTEDGQAPEARA